MPKSPVLGYSVLMFAGLGLAYWSSLPRSKDDDISQIVFKVSRDAIAKVEFVGESKSVQIRTEDKRHWVDFSQTIKAKKEGEEDEVKALSFLASDDIKSIFEKFEPLKAAKAIGEFSKPEELEEFGLKEPAKVITVHKKDGSQFVLEVGKKSYGSDQYFVREKGKKEVLLFDGSLIATFESADRSLFERKLAEFRIDMAEKLAVKHDGKDASFAKKKSGEEGKETFSWVTADDKEAKEVANWLKNIQRLQAIEYASPEVAAELEKKSVELAVDVAKSATEKDVLQFKSNEVEQKGKKVAEYWVRSNFTSTYVRVNTRRYETMVADLKKLL